MPANRSPYALEELTVIFHRSRLGALWRWRSELGLLTGGVTGFFECAHCTGLVPAGIAYGGGAALSAALPWSRRLLATRFWALYTRHRLQRAFWELRLHTRAGRLPLIVRITATPVGSRALIIFRAGMTFEDFEDSAAAFAAACGARECRVTLSPRWSWLLFIDIIRRDVLGPAHVIRSPLADLPATVPAAAPSWPEPALTEDQS